MDGVKTPLTSDLRLVIALAAVLIAGCTPTLTDQQKFDRAKQCIDAGLVPDVYRDVVICHAVEKN